MIKSYRELRRLRTFEERYDYLRLGGVVGRETFGYDRYFNQRLYQSFDWQSVRDRVIIRDESCDLGILDRQIYGRLLIHHINPITIADIEQGVDCLFDPDNLITTCHNTHNAIHYGDKLLLNLPPQEREKGDTSLWKAFSLP
jgi:hypothetical protein